jgi:hypothetical protein
MEWIEMEKQKPNPCIDILFTDGKEIYKGWLETYEECEDLSFCSMRASLLHDAWPENITHWMPLPKLPKSER